MNVPPPVPLPDTPPEPVNGHLPVEDWLQHRLISQFDPLYHARYEASLYGILNSLFVSQFPMSRKFMVKPQAILWAVDDGLELGPGQANTSGGASGRGIPIYPDFVICRANEQLYNDCNVCIVEVKRQGEELDIAEAQLLRYLTRASNERWKVGILHGFLIVGNQCHVYFMDTTPGHTGVDLDATYEVGATHGIEFKQALFRIARKYWGDMEVQWAQTNYVGPYELP